MNLSETGALERERGMMGTNSKPEASAGVAGNMAETLANLKQASHYMVWTASRWQRMAKLAGMIEVWEGDFDPMVRLTAVGKAILDFWGKS